MQRGKLGFGFLESQSPDTSAFKNRRVPVDVLELKNPKVLKVYSPQNV